MTQIPLDSSQRHSFTSFPHLVRQWKYGSSPGSSSASWSSGSSSPPLSDDNNNNSVMNNRNRTASLSTSDEGIVMDLMPKKVSAVGLTFVETRDQNGGNYNNDPKCHHCKLYQRSTLPPGALTACLIFSCRPQYLPGQPQRQCGWSGYR